MAFSLNPGGLSFSSKCRRFFPLPVASSKVLVFTSFFSFGIAALAASKRSAALSDFRIYFSSSGADSSSSVNFSREDFVSAAISACAFCTAFLEALRVWAASMCSIMRSAVPVSALEAVNGADGKGAASGMGVVSCAASCAACCSGVFSKSVSCSRLLIRSAVCLVSLTSTAPSRVIFCVILSRGLYSFKRFHLLMAGSTCRFQYPQCI